MTDPDASISLRIVRTSLNLDIEFTARGWALVVTGRIKMRPTQLRTSLIASLLLATVSFMAGCAACGCPGCDKSQFPRKTASATLQNVRDDYKTAALQAEDPGSKGGKLGRGLLRRKA